MLELEEAWEESVPLTPSFHRRRAGIQNSCGYSDMTNDWKDTKTFHLMAVDSNLMTTSLQHFFVKCVPPWACPIVNVWTCILGLSQLYQWQLHIPKPPSVTGKLAWLVSLRDTVRWLQSFFLEHLWSYWTLLVWDIRGLAAFRAGCGKAHTGPLSVYKVWFKLPL